MKVLLCTPFKNDQDIVRGGINQWGKNILSYYENHKEGIEIVPVSFDRHISRIRSKNTFQRLMNGIREQITPISEAIKAMKTIKPDVVHVCTSAGMGCLRDYLLVRIARRLHIKSVVHLHFGRLPELAEKKNWEWWLLRSVIKKCDVVVPMNRPTEKALFDNGFNHVKYLPNPLSKDIVEQISKLEGTVRRCPKRLLYVGHVYETKGVFELVEGCRDIEDVKLRIVGKYTQDVYERLISASIKARRKDWIEFAGELPHEEVLKEFMMADMFVFPSYTEGFPNVILEAMACSCPIIASNVGAIPEMLDVDNKPCGICIEPRSAKNVHDAVAGLLRDDMQKRNFAEKAKQRVNSLYAMPVVWKELVKIWRTESNKTI